MSNPVEVRSYGDRRRADGSIDVVTLLARVCQLLLEEIDGVIKVGHDNTTFKSGRGASSGFKCVWAVASPLTAPEASRTRPAVCERRITPLSSNHSALVYNELGDRKGKPPSESRKPRAPAFTIGQKLLAELPAGKVGPGPASYNTEGMTAKGETALRCCTSIVSSRTSI
ncbi:hypothetical protein EVAR_2500_1 [Eumeta japonica]|uniref:Uncharacterized protein n=1 Tax=Eumeta variegata TaxID=151549 RepID=A0A4C1SP74_EUMVA|nr:hypothetical protein EVAR_2500_1 [Eumeta japonica]